MTSTKTRHQNTIPPTHQDFRWIHGPGQDQALADFVELTRDISAGIHSCLQLIFASDLVREQNEDAESGCASAPAIGKTDAFNLCRMSLTVSKLLLAAAQDRIDGLNAVKEI